MASQKAALAVFLMLEFWPHLSEVFFYSPVFVALLVGVKLCGTKARVTVCEINTLHMSVPLCGCPPTLSSRASPDRCCSTQR